MTETTNNEVSTDQQAQQIDVVALQAEVERLRTHSAELLADLKAERKAHNQTKNELQSALGGESATWKERYQREAVDMPLKRELESFAAVPVQYLLDILSEKGLLKMELDADGINRPSWYDLEGNQASMPTGLHRFLISVYDQNQDHALGTAIKGLGASGGGMPSTFSGARVSEIQPETKSEPQKLSVGLR